MFYLANTFELTDLDSDNNYTLLTFTELKNVFNNVLKTTSYLTNIKNVGSSISKIKNKLHPNILLSSYSSWLKTNKTATVFEQILDDKPHC